MSRETVLISMGSNLGSRRGTLSEAVRLIAALPRLEITAVSSLWETEAWGGPAGQRPYLNAAVRADVGLGDPEGLLRAMLEIEARAGRKRGIRNGPRTLDLDLLLYGERRCDEVGLRLPHPRMLDRAFVMAPAAEIAEDLVHPVSGRLLRDHADEIGRDGIIARIDAADWCTVRAVPKG